MTDRGEATRERLIRATRQVVRDTGCSQATTRTIARAAGVTEGTIYRHFPNKTTLFFAAAMERHTEIVAKLADFPARAGQGTVAGNLTEALTSLAALREDIMPLELAILTDPDLAAGRDAAVAAGIIADGGGPPEQLARYVAAEQRLGRVRPDLDPTQVARTLLALLLAHALQPAAPGTPLTATVADSIDLVVRGLSAAEPPRPGPPRPRQRRGTG